MTSTDVEIVNYRPEFKPLVVDLMQYLWGSDGNRNLSYFEWKYEANPYGESPLGFVALQYGRVVGFRGFFARLFEVPGRNDNLLILCPGDTCVHPDFRRLALSVKMGNLAMKEYAGTYRIFLNTSCNRASLPGYLKMGFLPLAGKAYASRSTFSGLVRYILSRKHIAPVAESRIKFGSFGNILVSQEPRPEEMSLLVAGEHKIDGRIRLVQDVTFFRWRFGNPQGKYVFYYRLKDGVAAGYVILNVSPNNQRGYIVDYAPAEGQSLQDVLGYIIQSKQFDILSIYTYCLDDRLWQALKALGFKEHSLVRALERRLTGELPLLIRPVEEKYHDADCIVEGLDIRHIENWSFKPVVSDAV